MSACWRTNWHDMWTQRNGPWMKSAGKRNDAFGIYNCVFRLCLPSQKEISSWLIFCCCCSCCCCYCCRLVSFFLIRLLLCIQTTATDDISTNGKRVLFSVLLLNKQCALQISASPKSQIIHAPARTYIHRDMRRTYTHHYHINLPTSEIHAFFMILT